MAGQTRTAAEEAAFMNDLISGLNDDFWNAPPSPDKIPLPTTRVSAGATGPKKSARPPAPAPTASRLPQPLRTRTTTAPIPTTSSSSRTGLVPIARSSSSSGFPSSSSSTSVLRKASSTAASTSTPTISSKPTTATSSSTSSSATVYPSKTINKYRYQPPAPVSAQAKPLPKAQPKFNAPQPPPPQQQQLAIDLSAFLEGSENWDLDLNDDDLLSSPIKPKAKSKVKGLSPVKAKILSPVKSKGQKQANASPHTYIPDPCTRCIAESIIEEQVNGRWRKTILAKIDYRRNFYSDNKSNASEAKNDEKVSVHLCDDWYQTDIRPDDVFNVLGIFSSATNSKRAIHITSQANLLILHPDLLITATALSNAPQCRRKPVLGTLLKVVSSGSSIGALQALNGDGHADIVNRTGGAKKNETGITPSLVWGNMLHEVTQKCLVSWDLWPFSPYSPSSAKENNEKAEAQWEAFVDTCIDEAVCGGLGELVKLGGWEGYAGFSGQDGGKMAMTEEVARREVKERAKGLEMFRRRYLNARGASPALPKTEGTITNTRSKDAAKLAITRILDVEEDIWSPRYGLKGKIDVTVEGIIQEHESFSKGGFAPRSAPSPYPLELKTGRPSYSSLEHRAQTMLYTLLLSERYTGGMEYAREVDDGLLFYTQSEDGEVVRVPRGKNEIRALIGARNELAAWGWRRVRKSGKGGKVHVKEEEVEESADIAGMDVDIEDTGSSGSKLQVIPKGGKEQETEEEEQPFLPPPIDNERECKRCYALDTCLLFRKTHPNHSSSTSGASSSRDIYDPPLPDFLTNPQHITASSNGTQNTTTTTPAKATLKSLFDLKTGHLTPTRIDFFRKWEKMLGLEERDLVRYKRELWTLGAEERERRGRCWGSMRLLGDDENNVVEKAVEVKIEEGGVGGDEDEADGDRGKWGKEGKIHRFRYTFERSSRVYGALSGSIAGLNCNSASSNLLNGHMSVGDAITVSVQGEPRLLALARGFIVELSKGRVVIGVDHVLDVEDIRTKMRKADDAEMKEILFRIDKDELFGGMSRIRNNLAQLFYADGDRKRLELVVDLRKPVFNSLEDIKEEEEKVNLDFDTDVKMEDVSSPSNSTMETTPHHNLNPTQHLALRKALSARDYSLILGMPGTGKTTVIAALIKELVVERGKTVLLTSYTHSAVDTILRKLDGVGAGVDDHLKRGTTEAEGRFRILRLGNVEKVHPEVRKYIVGQGATKQPQTVEEMERQLLEPPVVATTCLSIDHPLFSRRTFDYCIVDEASQITLPTCLGPLRFADTFILVGDHHQLPPLVKNPEARALGLDISLFKLLSTAHPEAVVDLRDQYRMNEDIMTLSNKLIYGDRLRCGNEEVRKRALRLPNKEGIHLGKENNRCLGKEDSCWLTKLADESCKAMFVDTDLLPNARESRVGDLVQNVVEAELVSQFVNTLLNCGVKKTQVGVISLYRQQVKLLEALLNGGEAKQRHKQGRGHDDEIAPVEIWTADKSQGRDKDCVVVSLVRSNEARTVGDLLKDWRRINVSFTRARSKLVIFGSRKTLGREPLLREFFELVESRGWILQLEKEAVEAHTGLLSSSEQDLHEVKMEMEDNGRTVEKRKLGKENLLDDSLALINMEKDARPVKKMRVNAGTALLKGRPVLRDVVGHDME